MPDQRNLEIRKSKQFVIALGFSSGVFVSIPVSTDLGAMGGSLMSNDVQVAICAHPLSAKRKHSCNRLVIWIDNSIRPAVEYQEKDLRWY